MKKLYIFVIFFIVFIIVIHVVNLNKKSLMQNESYIRPSVQSSYVQLIPKRIVQTGKTFYVPNDMKYAINSWITLNPEYEYYYYDDNACRAFLQEHFQPNVLQTFDKLIPGAFKADLFRLCELYINGGVYVDIDMVCVVPLREIISENDEFITPIDIYHKDLLNSLSRNPSSYNLYNAFIACTAKHSVLRIAINTIIHNVENKFYGQTALDPTGPRAFGHALNKYLNRESYSKFSEGYIDNLKIKLLLFISMNNRVYYNGKVVIIGKYENYFQDLMTLNDTYYGNLWYKRKIYKDC